MRPFKLSFKGGNLRPLEPLNLPENTRLTVAIMDEDDVSAKGIASLAEEGAAFDFLSDSREDMYSDSDGEAV